MSGKKYIIENKVTKWFVRGLTGIVLAAYTLDIVQHIVIDNNPISYNGTDWLLIAGSLTVWVAFESAVAWLKKKTGVNVNVRSITPPDDGPPPLDPPEDA